MKRLSQNNDLSFKCLLQISFPIFLGCLRKQFFRAGRCGILSVFHYAPICFNLYICSQEPFCILVVVSLTRALALPGLRRKRMTVAHGGSFIIHLAAFKTEGGMSKVYCLYYLSFNVTHEDIKGKQYLGQCLLELLWNGVLCLYLHMYTHKRTRS